MFGDITTKKERMTMGVKELTNKQQWMLLGVIVVLIILSGFFN